MGGENGKCRFTVCIEGLAESIGKVYGNPYVCKSIRVPVPVGTARQEVRGQKFKRS